MQQPPAYVPVRFRHRLCKSYPKPVVLVEVVLSYTYPVTHVNVRTSFEPSFRLNCYVARYVAFRSYMTTKTTTGEYQTRHLIHVVITKLMLKE